MSIVGTRPPTLDEWNKYELHHRARLAMVLLYQYCVKNEDFEFPLKILCGAMVGYRIQSRMMETLYTIYGEKIIP